MKLTKFLRRLKQKIRGTNTTPVAQLEQATKELPQESHRGRTLIKVLPGEKIRIVFLVITPELWPSVEPVWKRAGMETKCVASVVVLKSTNPDIALTTFLKAQALFEDAGISYFTENNFSIEDYQPHVVFYPLPYASLYPKQYKPELVAEMGCRIAYIPYGLEVGGGVFNTRYQYDTEVPRVAWRIFARSLGQLKSFSRYCSYGNGHVVLTGHPRTENNIQRESRGQAGLIEKTRGRSIILWTPHFTVTTRRKWSSFLDHQETIIKLIDERPDLFLLVRPHPFLKSSLGKLADWGPERVTNWCRQIDEKENMQMDNHTDYRYSFEVSSALMADAGSFLVEYLLTKKPICHLTGKDDIGLSGEVRSLACYYPGATEHDLRSFLDRVVLDNVDPLSSARKSAVRTYFCTGDQAPSQAILSEVIHHVNDLTPRAYSADFPASKPHDEAYQYWLKATSTYLAPEAYYQAQETKLREILSRHANGLYAVDIGCGNGRFTEIIGEHFDFTEATDPNPQLINEAREHASELGLGNIAYSVERLEHAESLSTYDFVSCMGVTSGLVDDEVFIKSIWKLKAAMRSGAKLLMKDSLSLSTGELIDWNGYTAVYRNVSSYLQVFEAAGLTLVEDLLITQDPEKKRINSFYIFVERNGASPWFG